MSIEQTTKRFFNVFIKAIEEISFLGWSGFLATLIGIVSFLPIIYKIIKTKNTVNFTITNLILALLSNVLWIVYGVGDSLFMPTLSGVLYFIIYSIILFYKLFF